MPDDERFNLLVARLQALEEFVLISTASGIAHLAEAEDAIKSWGDMHLGKLATWSEQDRDNPAIVRQSEALLDLFDRLATLVASFPRDDDPSLGI